MVAFDHSAGGLRLRGLARAPSPGTSYELRSSLDAPLIAIRYLLGLPLAEPVPPVVLRLGTTRGTNALITRGGARTALVTTRGFGDVLEIGYQARPRLFDLTVRKPPPLSSAVIEIDERVTHAGEVLAVPREADVRQQLEVAPRCRRRVARDLPVARGSPRGTRTMDRSAGAGSWLHGRQCVARGRTVAEDRPPRRYDRRRRVSQSRLARLRRPARGGASRQSASPAHVRRRAGRGGRIPRQRQHSLRPGRRRGRLLARRRGGRFFGGDRLRHGRHEHRRCPLRSRLGGQFDLEYETEKAGVRVVAPTMAIETVAAGGGSICRFDGVKLVVGPESAGADPGPACYGRGGPLTVTDCNLILGRIAAERFPFPLDRAAAEQRLKQLAAEVATPYSVEELAAGLVQIANANMAAAIRLVTVAKGANPADYLLVAFGSAAPQHACAVARELGIRQVLVHPDAGILSAVGIGLADVTRHRSIGGGATLGPIVPRTGARATRSSGERSPHRSPSRRRRGCTNHRDAVPRSAL